jgi:hypothetical protein
MSFHRRVPWFLALPLIAVALASVTAARWPGPILSCQIAAAWVADHASELPTTLDGIRRYSGSYQIAILSAIPNEARKQMWVEQLESFVASETSLTPLQRSILANAPGAPLNDHQKEIVKKELRRLDLYFDANRSIAERQAAIDLSVPVLRGAFEPVLLNAIFKTLGPTYARRDTVTAAAVASQPARDTSNAELTAKLPATAATHVLPPGCNCYTLGDQCCGPDACGGGTTNMTCGFYHDQPCDGTTYVCSKASVASSKSSSR